MSTARRTATRPLVWAACRAEASSRPLLVVHALGQPTSGDLLAGAQVSRELAMKEATRITEDAVLRAHRAAPVVDVDVAIEDADARQALIARSGRAGWSSSAPAATAGSPPCCSDR